MTLSPLLLERQIWDLSPLLAWPPCKYILSLLQISACQGFGKVKLVKLTVQFSCSVMSNSLQSPGLQHARPPCPSPTPGVYSNSCPLSQWCHPTISSSVIPFSSCPQSFPALRSFPVSQFFAPGGQSIGLQLQLQHQYFQWIFRTDFL